MYAILLTAGPLEEAAAEVRRKAGLKRGEEKPVSEIFADGGRALDIVGAFAGISGRTLEKIRDIMEAAKEQPEKFGHLVEEMDRTGKVNGAHRKLKMARDEERVLSLIPTLGKHRALVIDPPWDYEWLSIAGRAALGYLRLSASGFRDGEFGMVS